MALVNDSENGARLARPGVGDEGRTVILEAAALEFMHSGFAATSIDAIADRLGSTKGKIYHYYRTKSDLFLDVQREAIAVALERVTPEAQSDDPPTERLRRMARAQMAVIIEHFALQQVALQGIEKWATNVAPRAEFLEIVVQLRDRYEELFVEVVRAGVKSGEFRKVNPRRAVRALLGALNWTAMWYRPGESTRTEDEALIDEFAEFVTRGLLAERPS